MACSLPSAHKSSLDEGKYSTFECPCYSFSVEENKSANNPFQQQPNDVYNTSLAGFLEPKKALSSILDDTNNSQADGKQITFESVTENIKYHGKRFTCWAFGWYCPEEVFLTSRKESSVDPDEETNVKIVENEVEDTCCEVDIAAEHYIDPCGAVKTKKRKNDVGDKKSPCAGINPSSYRSFPVRGDLDGQQQKSISKRQAQIEKQKLKQKYKQKEPSPKESPKEIKSPNYPQTPKRKVQPVIQHCRTGINKQHGINKCSPFLERPEFSREIETVVQDFKPNCEPCDNKQLPPCYHKDIKHNQEQYCPCCGCSCQPKQSDNKDIFRNIGDRYHTTKVCEKAKALLCPPKDSCKREIPPPNLFPNKCILENIKYLPKLPKRKRLTKRKSPKRRQTCRPASAPGIQILFQPGASKSAPDMCSSFPRMMPLPRCSPAPYGITECSLCMNNCGPNCSCAICKILHKDKNFGSYPCQTSPTCRRSVTPTCNRRCKSQERLRCKKVGQKSPCGLRVPGRGRGCGRAGGAGCGGKGKAGRPLCTSAHVNMGCQRGDCRPTSSICRPECGMPGSPCVWSGLGYAYERSTRGDALCRSLLAKYGLGSVLQNCYEPSPATRGGCLPSTYTPPTYQCSYHGDSGKATPTAKKKSATKASPPAEIYEQEIPQAVNNSRKTSVTPDQMVTRSNIKYSQRPKARAVKEVALTKRQTWNFDPPPITKYKGIAGNVSLFTSLSKTEYPQKVTPTKSKHSAPRSRSGSPVKKDKNNGALDHEDAGNLNNNAAGNHVDFVCAYRDRLASNFRRRPRNSSQARTFHRLDEELTKVTRLTLAEAEEGAASLADDDDTRNNMAEADVIDDVTGCDEEFTFSPPDQLGCQNNNFGEENFRFFRKYLRITPSTSSAHSQAGGGGHSQAQEEALRQDMLLEARAGTCMPPTPVSHEAPSDGPMGDQVDEKIARLDDWILGNYPEGFSMVTGSPQKKSSQALNGGTKRKDAKRSSKKRTSNKTASRHVKGRSADVEVAKRVLTINPSELLKNRSPARSNAALWDGEGMDGALASDTRLKPEAPPPLMPPPEHYSPQWTMDGGVTESDYIDDDYATSQLMTLPHRAEQPESQGVMVHDGTGARTSVERVTSPVRSPLLAKNSMPNSGYKIELQKSPYGPGLTPGMRHTSPRKRDDGVKKDEEPTVEDEQEGLHESSVDRSYVSTNLQSDDIQVQRPASLTQSLFSRFTSMFPAGPRSRGAASDVTLQATPTAPSHSSRHILGGHESSVDLDHSSVDGEDHGRPRGPCGQARDGSANNDYDVTELHSINNNKCSAAGEESRTSMLSLGTLVDQPACAAASITDVREFVNGDVRDDVRDDLCDKVRDDVDDDMRDDMHDNVRDYVPSFASVSVCAAGSDSGLQLHESASRNHSLNRARCISDESLQACSSLSQVRWDRVHSPRVSAASSSCTLCDHGWTPRESDGPIPLTRKIGQMNLAGLMSANADFGNLDLTLDLDTGHAISGRHQWGYEGSMTDLKKIDGVECSVFSEGGDAPQEM